MYLLHNLYVPPPQKKIIGLLLHTFLPEMEFCHADPCFVKNASEFSCSFPHHRNFLYFELISFKGSLPKIGCLRTEGTVLIAHKTLVYVLVPICKKLSSRFLPLPQTPPLYTVIFFKSEVFNLLGCKYPWMFAINVYLCDTYVTRI